MAVLNYKLTVFRPTVMTERAEQIGFDYELDIQFEGPIPSDLTSPRPRALPSAPFTGQVSPFTGQFSFPNPAAPVISPIEGAIFFLSNPAIGFPLELIGQSTETFLPVQLQMVFTNAPATTGGGVVTFGQGWPGPFNSEACSFLASLA